jgi:hypothetical protein
MIDFQTPTMEFAGAENSHQGVTITPGTQLILVEDL